MTRQITHVSIHQTSKVFALVYFCFSLLVVPVGVALMAVYPQARGIGLFFIFAPVIYAVAGYLGFCAVCGDLQLSGGTRRRRGVRQCRQAGGRSRRVRRSLCSRTW